MKFHYHILINPSAGSGNGYKVAERILPVLKISILTIHFIIVNTKDTMLRLLKLWQKKH
ncbi:diacylglycerol kinase catalytic subunit [Enterococcus faecium Aus0085]|nr:diacylglycerol kinase catalytic subunit [Enterococcus faecium Aus0085]